MRQLRSCDFCGADASGIYEVLPAELSPTEDEQRRVVLCEDCLGTLETVVNPLLTRLGVDATASVDDDEADARSESSEPVAASQMHGREAESGTDNGSVTAPETDATDVTPMTTAEESSADGEGATDETSDEETHDEETFGDRPAEDYEVEEADRKRSVDGDPEEDYEVEDDTDATPVSEEVANDEESAESEPPRFRKVMRLLNNREFPVNRAEFADLASGAYELDRSEVATIIDYAVQRDVLEEENGQLRKAS